MITSSIPQPKSGADAFMEGATTAQGIFNSMVENRLRNQQMQQSEKMNPLEIQYKQAQIRDILSQEAQRKAQVDFANMINGTGGAQPPTGSPTNSQTAMQPPPVSPSNRPGNQLTTADQQNYAGFPTAMHGLPTSAFQQDHVMAGGTPLSSPPPNAAVPVAPPMGNPSPAQANNAPKLPTELGQETELSAPTRNPLVDKYAGNTMFGLRVPDKKVLPVVDGYQTTNWPSGRVTVRKVGLTDQEKLEAKEAEAEKKEQNKSDVKTKAKIEADAKDLVESAHDYQKLKELNEKNITGVIPGKLAKWGLSTNEDLGAFNELATRAQGRLSKFLSNRGGAVALQTAQPGKPNAGSQMPYNRGLINSGIETIKQQYEDLNSEYKKITGKNLDLTLPVFEKAAGVSAKKEKSADDIVSVKDTHTGKIAKMKRSEAEALMRGSG